MCDYGRLVVRMKSKKVLWCETEGLSGKGAVGI